MSAITKQRAPKTGADDSMAVPVGYKRTEVGVIPDDWGTSQLRSLCANIIDYRGRTPRKLGMQWGGGEIPALSARNVRKGRIDLDEETYYGSEELYQRWMTNGDTKMGDLVVTLEAPLGNVAIIPNHQKYILSQRTILVQFKSEIAHSLFYFHLFVAERFQNLLAQNATGSTASGIRRMQFERLNVALPLFPEQHAIAEALSDVDGLLGALERLIVKKGAIKQAAMQQLLTGKTRLPGFSGPWEMRRLGEVATIRNQKVMPGNVEPDTRCVELEHIGQRNGHLLGYSTARTSTSAKYRFFAGDVLFGRLRSYLRKYWLADSDGICTTEIWPFMVDPSQAVSGFLRGIVESERFIESASISYGTHMPRADWGVLRNFEVQLPEMAEQNAIANVLSDMDADIAALERRRDKTRAIKQGMMQQLLTGRIRLVKDEVYVSAPQVEADRKASNPHSWAFNEAVVISTLAKHFGKEAYPLGRKRYTKLSYLLHRHVERRTEGYLKKAAGPYNPKTKYAGPERIALENGYIRKHKRDRYAGFVAADNVGQAEGYFEKWYGSDPIKWLYQFRYESNDALEILATVDMAAEELRASGRNVNVEAVKDLIGSHPEWEAKLDRDAFSDQNIGRAILESEGLFGSSEGRSA